MPVWLNAQINTGRITGYVRDASGAVVPSASIQTTNVATGVVTKTASLGTGEYVINFLIPGTYTIEISKDGFLPQTQTGLTVSSGGITRLDIALKVGNVRQTVEVVANPSAVATETSELSQIFTAEEVLKLPNLDRNPLFMMNLLPGANNDRGSGTRGVHSGEQSAFAGYLRPESASLGGISASANTIFIEGIMTREPQNNHIGMVPPSEAVEEVQVYTGKYNAEFGFSGSTVVNVVTKSGTNEFHGSLSEYLQNDKLNARSFFDSSKLPFKKNLFGAGIGGPIRKNKIFFFADYQGTYYRSSSSGLTTVPTDKMYQGDFTELYNLSKSPDGAGNTYGQIYDPFTRTFDGSGKVISTTPFAGNIIPQSRWDRSTAKMNNEAIFGRANRSGLDSNLYYILTNAQTAHQGDGRVDYNLSEKDRFFYRYSAIKPVINVSTSVNDLWSAGKVDSDTLNQNMQFTAMHTFSPAMMNELRLGYNRTNTVDNLKSMAKDWNNYFEIPNGNLGDSITRGIANVGASPVHSVGDPGWAGFIISNTIALNENFTYVRSKHNMKFGTSINWMESTSTDSPGQSPRGSFGFDSAMTSFNGSGAAPYAYPSFLLGTATSAVRARFVNGWPYQTFWQNAWYAQDDFKVLPSLTLNIGMRYELTTLPKERYNRQANFDTRTNELVVATPDNRSPALAMDKGDWGPRVGFAWTPDQGKTSLRGGFGISYWQTQYRGPVSFLGLNYPNFAEEDYLSTNNLTPSLLVSRDGLPVAKAQYDASGKLVIPSNAALSGNVYDWKSQRADQLSLNLQRQVFGSFVADVGYLQVRGRHLDWTSDINTPDPSPVPININQSRPLYSKFPQLTSITIQQCNAQSNYDALTARLFGRFHKWILVNANYAHGRALASGQNTNVKDVNQYYGPSAEDIAHIFNAQVSVELPVGRGKTLGATMNPVLDKIVGGWQVSTLAHARSGTRFGVSASTSLLNNGQSNHADRIGDGNLPVSERTLAHWYDTSAFVNDLIPGTWGNAGSNPLIADGQIQFDSSIFKTFKIAERYNLQFRTDLFNTFNHPDFGPPTAKIGSSSNGKVTSASVDGRRIQFALRLSF